MSPRRPAPASTRAASASTGRRRACWTTPSSAIASTSSPRRCSRANPCSSTTRFASHHAVSAIGGADESHRRQRQLAQHGERSCRPSATSPRANCARPAIGSRRACPRVRWCRCWKTSRHARPCPATSASSSRPSSAPPRTRSRLRRACCAAAGARTVAATSTTPATRRSASDVQFFSGQYAVQREQCNGVDVEVFHHPTHDGVVEAHGAQRVCRARALHAGCTAPTPTARCASSRMRRAASAPIPSPAWSTMATVSRC